MVGNAPDLMRLLEAIRMGGEPILSEATAASMLRNQIGSLMGRNKALAQADCVAFTNTALEGMWGTSRPTCVTLCTRA